MLRTCYSVVVYLGVLIVSLPLRATSISVTYGEESSGVADVTTATFDLQLVLPSQFIGLGDGVQVAPANTSATGNHAIPSLDKTNYLYICQNSAVVQTFLKPVDYVGLYWGSPDAYNELSLTDMNGLTETFVPGKGLLSALIPDQSSAAYVEFISSTTGWKALALRSAGNAFEVDNVSTASPEPAPEPKHMFICALILLASSQIKVSRIDSRRGQFSAVRTQHQGRSRLNL